MTISTNGDQNLERARLVMIGSCLCLLPIAIANGAQYHCSLELNGTCVTKVKWNIPQRYADLGRPFTLFLTSAEEKTETAAVLYYLGYYHCEAAGGHVCDNSNSLSLMGVSVTTCVSGGNYTLAADGEPSVPCTALSAGSDTNDRSKNGTTNHDNSHVPNEAIIGISTGIIFVSSLLAAASVYLWKKGCRKQQQTVYFTPSVTFSALPTQKTNNKETMNNELDILV